jgi:hypothetical protein
VLLTTIANDCHGGRKCAARLSKPSTMSTSGRQKLRMAVVPSQRAFKKGVAFGQAALEVCDNNGCRGIADQHNIQIVKP